MNLASLPIDLVAMPVALQVAATAPVSPGFASLLASLEIAPADPLPAMVEAPPSEVAVPILADADPLELNKPAGDAQAPAEELPVPVPLPVFPASVAPSPALVASTAPDDPDAATEKSEDRTPIEPKAYPPSYAVVVQLPLPTPGTLSKPQRREIEQHTASTGFAPEGVVPNELPASALGEHPVRPSLPAPPPPMPLVAVAPDVAAARQASVATPGIETAPAVPAAPVPAGLPAPTRSIEPAPLVLPASVQQVLGSGLPREASRLGDEPPPHARRPVRQAEGSRPAPPAPLSPVEPVVAGLPATRDAGPQDAPETVRLAAAPAAERPLAVTGSVTGDPATGIELATERLGTVRVALAARDTQVAVQFTTESATAAGLLAVHSPRLSEAVLAAGRFQGVAVDVGGGGTSSRHAPEQRRESHAQPAQRRLRQPSAHRVA